MLTRISRSGSLYNNSNYQELKGLVGAGTGNCHGGVGSVLTVLISAPNPSVLQDFEGFAISSRRHRDSTRDLMFQVCLGFDCAHWLNCTVTDSGEVGTGLSWRSFEGPRLAGCSIVAKTSETFSRHQSFQMLLNKMKSNCYRCAPSITRASVWVVSTPYSSPRLYMDLFNKFGWGKVSRRPVWNLWQKMSQKVPYTWIC